MREPQALPARIQGHGQLGAALVYYIIVLVVMSTLAAGMLTLFDTSARNAASMNYHKLALYMAESGLRYVQSQMKGPGSIAQKMGDINAIPMYNVEGDLKFEANVYTLGTFKSVNADHVPANTAMILELPSGDPFPKNYEVPTFGDSANDLYLVSNQDMDFIQALNNARTIGSTLSSDRRQIYVTVQDAIEPDMAGRLYYLACQVITGNQTIEEGDSLTVNACGWIYPEKWGIVTIRSHDYIYDKRVDNGNGTYTFTNLRKPPDASGNPQTWESGFTNDSKNPGDDLKNLGNGDFVVLNSLNNQNMWVESIGYAGPTAEQASKELEQTFYVAEQARQPKGSITFEDEHNIVSSDPAKEPIVNLDTQPGISIGANEFYAFGAIWYRGTKHGVNLYCVNGECDFGLGIRVFFTVKFDVTDADGFVYAVINNVLNDYYAIGGDSSMGELLAFAGDSRVYTSGGSDDANGIDFWVDPERNGIQPPKIGIEFDTWYNGGRSCLCYRSDNKGNISSITLDPAADHIGYMFWGSDAQPGSCGNGFTCKDQTSTVGVASTPEGLLTYDDLIHGSGRNTVPGDVFHATSSLQEWWRTDTSVLYGVRIEIHRSLNKIIDATDPNYNKYEYILRTFVHSCTEGTNCAEYVGVEDSLADLDGDFLVNPTANPLYAPVLEKAYYLEEAEHNMLDKILLGFTEATGAATQIAKITNYEVKFRSGGDESIFELP